MDSVKIIIYSNIFYRVYVNVSKIKDFNAEKIKDIDINDHRIDLRDL